MKKILLGTTVLVGFAALSSAAFAGETPKVTIGGYSDFQVGITNEDVDTNKRSQAFRSDNVITFRVDGKTDAGLEYGAGVDLHADTSNDADNSYTTGGTARRTFSYLGGQWGRVEMGSTTGVATALKVDASRVARATGGIDGDFTYFINSPTNAVGTQVIATPDLPSDYGFDGVYTTSSNLGDKGQENANKVNYYTPRFAGFQAGVSYIIDTNKGQTVDRLDNGSGALVENIFEGGLTYEGKFSDVSFAAAVTGTKGSATVATTQDLKAWNAGAKVGYMGFSLAGSYGSWGDSLRVTGQNGLDSSYYTAGVAYETGPFGVSVTYLNSTFESTSTADNEFKNVTIGADYKLAPGLTPYAEVSFIDMDVATNASDNEATVFLVGSQLSF